MGGKHHKNGSKTSFTTYPDDLNRTITKECVYTSSSSTPPSLPNLFEAKTNLDLDLIQDVLVNEEGVLDIDRNKAEDLLKDAPPHTYMFRTSSLANIISLSIKRKKPGTEEVEVYHCSISKVNDSFILEKGGGNVAIFSTLNHLETYICEDLNLPFSGTLQVKKSEARNKAVDLLRYAPAGTYLFRPSNEGVLACSYVKEGSIWHVRILKDDKGMFKAEGREDTYLSLRDLEHALIQEGTIIVARQKIIK